MSKHRLSLLSSRIIEGASEKEEERSGQEPGLQLPEILAEGVARGKGENTNSDATAKIQLWLREA